MSTNFDEDCLIIARELNQLNKTKYTGKAIFELNMGQGGIASISLKLDRTLKNSSNKQNLKKK